VSDEPVVVLLTVEAHPRKEEIEIPRADWDAMTPEQRTAYLDNEVDTCIANAGGAGWFIVSGATDAETA
jgi:hypothetical protein